jgi:hypothetical protein
VLAPARPIVSPPCGGVIADVAMVLAVRGISHVTSERDR